MGGLLFLFGAVLLLMVPVYTGISMVRAFFWKKRMRAGETFDILCLIGICLIFGMGFYSDTLGVKGGEPLHIYEATGAFADGYSPFAAEGLFSVIFLLIAGIISYIILFSYSDKLSPVLYVILSLILVMNGVQAVLFLTHTGINHYGDGLFTGFTVIFFQIGFISLLFLYMTLLKESMDKFSKRQQELGEPSGRGILAFFYRLSLGYQKMPRLLGGSFSQFSY
ncbi:DUF6688 domain-containing protein [Bacillus massiliglaciei]|uniref:DUF6688 domain-containing protein n=1 Tax=Bacillus massiliglaciei TaxID=1816693 RepID=UPI000DA5ECDD|nr:DUF6688 family protein [Bacillus massiliglaciei]